MIGRWVRIRDTTPELLRRRNVDLKDKWCNLEKLIDRPNQKQLSADQIRRVRVRDDLLAPGA